MRCVAVARYPRAENSTRTCVRLATIEGFPESLLERMEIDPTATGKRNTSGLTTAESELEHGGRKAVRTSHNAVARDPSGGSSGLRSPSIQVPQPPSHNSLIAGSGWRWRSTALLTYTREVS